MKKQAQKKGHPVTWEQIGKTLKVILFCILLALAFKGADAFFFPDRVLHDDEIACVAVVQKLAGGNPVRLWCKEKDGTEWDIEVEDAFPR